MNRKEQIAAREERHRERQRQKERERLARRQAAEKPRPDVKKESEG